ncbi:MAG: prepilin-type N-terminal cleavage/methylation domain-containing protein [Chromatiaceae bacterium]|nr:prepilin-type N-terminal cleavage/methylation domain-containing protein [Chromatiaceae bacterium]
MNRQRGFTLVEMLIALSVAALLITLCYGAIRVSQRSAYAMQEKVVESEVMRIGWQFINDALGRARAVSNPEERDDKTSFEGTATRVAFVADLPGYVGTGGLTRVVLDVEQDQGQRRLVLSHERFPPESDDAPPSPVGSATLVDQLAAIEIAYFGKADDDEVAAWRDDWSGQGHLPNLVRIQVEPSGQPPWPVLIARPLSDTRAIDEQDTPDASEEPGDEPLQNDAGDETEPPGPADDV